MTATETVTLTFQTVRSKMVNEPKHTASEHVIIPGTGDFLLSRVDF